MICISGLLMEIGYVVEDMMVTACWTARSLEGFIKFVKYIQLAASNMLAITNLAICVNLALIVMVSYDRHRTPFRICEHQKQKQYVLAP